MQDEEKNEAGAGGENLSPEAAGALEAAAQSQYEVVHHPLLFGI